MAVYNLKAAKAYIHSFEEPAKETLQTITDAIKNGALQGVQMIGEATLPDLRQPALAHTKQ
ncbi:MAG: hypothetical protein COB76_00760 [Alphaproteobacteria bacterium]|nr:MAG: hypothetical protein COB76_00760 [Alphaproteobacteria bacterium]